MPRTALVSALTGAVVAVAACLGALAATGSLTRDGDDPVPPAARAAGPAPATTPTVAGVYRRARAGVLLVEARPEGTPTPTGPPRRGDGVATGSGFAIGSGRYVVTNAHVVAGGGRVTVGFGRRDARDGVVVGRDPGNDLALIRVSKTTARRFRALALGDSRRVRVGDPALAIGNPFGLDRTLTLGIVSGTGREIEAPGGSEIGDAIQTDAPINPGNSGGPLLDAHGRVIGVNSQSRGDGLGFAVPVESVKRLVRRLDRQGRL